MSTAIAEIGRCIGCDRTSRLDGGVCQACLHHPKRGRSWAQMSHRCRTDPGFALAVYERIKHERGRRLFLRVYGTVLLAHKSEGPGNDV